MVAPKNQKRNFKLMTSKMEREREREKETENHPVT